MDNLNPKKPKETTAQPAEALKTVALVGRPNVGKSSFFNMLLGREKSIVHEKPGTTRDFVDAEVAYKGTKFRLIDTAGAFDEHAVEQDRFFEKAAIVFEKADALLFMVDAKAGLLPGDKSVARMVRKMGKEIFLVANKTDSEKLRENSAEFFTLGFGDPNVISVHQGLGLDPFFANVFEYLGLDFNPKYNKKSAEPLEEDPDDGSLKIAIVGKPNVGKSSYVNCLLGYERVVVSSKPGTTLDSVDVHFEYAGNRFRIMDSAGIRRKRGVESLIEKKAVARSLSAIDRADVVFMMCDGSEPVSEQDLKIASFIQEKKKPSVLIMSKWDIPLEGKQREKYQKDLREKFHFLSDPSVCFLSSLNGKGVLSPFEKAGAMCEKLKRRITTGELNRFLQDAINHHQPSAVQGKTAKFYYVTQTLSSPPVFLFSINNPDAVHFSYKRFLANRLRETFELHGVPVSLQFRGRGKVLERKLKKLAGRKR